MFVTFLNYEVGRYLTTHLAILHDECLPVSPRHSKQIPPIFIDVNLIKEIPSDLRAAGLKIPKIFVRIQDRIKGTVSRKLKGL